MTAGDAGTTRRGDDRRRHDLCRMPEQDRGRLLCEAAESVFIRDGYAAASMDEVARQAGMSKRTLYQVFPSKAALFEATFSAAVAPLHLDTELEREPDLGIALSGILEASAWHLLSLRQTAIFRLMISEGQRSPELAEALHRVIIGRGASALQRRLATAMRVGQVRLDDAAMAARLLLGMAVGPIQIKMLLGLRDAPDRAEVARVARLAVTVFLHGVLQQEPAPV